MSIISPTAAEVKAFRTEFKLTQARLCEVLGVSKRTVEVWETGASEPPAYLALAFAYLREHLEKLGPQPAKHVEAMKAIRTPVPPTAPRVEIPYAGSITRKPMQKGGKR